ncbi:MAG TPA: PGPGW domain-containing protein [Acidimicrobiales bacterium]|nr:PGPGW domain-containing protein [Acidimicrobiales bacterium]
MAKVVAVVRFMARQSFRLSVAAVGFTILAVGVVMLVTPGPGLLVIIAGLAILAHQFAWAARALEKAKQRAAQAKELALRRAAARRAEAPRATNIDFDR